MYKYPLTYRFRTNPELIVAFNSLTSGRVMSSSAGFYPVGSFVENLAPHSDASTWELLEAQNEFEVHDSIADQVMQILFLSGACDTESTGLRESIEGLLYGYEITPRPEPIYEWQFERAISGVALESVNWYTDQEAEDILGSKIGVGYRKLLETKRLRS